MGRKYRIENLIFFQENLYSPYTFFCTSKEFKQTLFGNEIKLTFRVNISLNVLENNVMPNVLMERTFFLVERKIYPFKTTKPNSIFSKLA